MAISSEEIPISHLQRRKIEGRVIIPLIEEARKRFGDQAAHEMVVAVIRHLAVEEEFWAGGGSLDLEVVAVSEDHLDFNVTRCRYAEFYRGLGLADLGYLIHCNRDHAMIEGFNPDLALTRTQTVMEGASHCDFRFSKKREV